MKAITESLSKTDNVIRKTAFGDKHRATPFFSLKFSAESLSQYWCLAGFSRKVTGGKATAKRSFAERVAKPKSDEKPARKTVYKVGVVEFNDYGAALQFAAQVFPNQNHPSSYITKEER